MTAAFKILLLLPIALLLTSCVKDALTTASTNNNNFHVEFLFENDGCKLYRFYDRRYVYYTNCTSGSHSVMQPVKEGKIEVYQEVK